MTRQTMFQAKKESQPLQTSSLFRRQAAQSPVEEREAAALPVNLGQDHSAIPFKPVHPAPALGPSSISCPFMPERCPFGGACHACPPKMQAKLKIGQPGDRYEQEADRVAEQVMRMPEPQVQRKCSAPGCKDEEEKKLLQTKSAGSAGNAQVDHPLIQNVLSSPGQPLDAGTRSFMEPRFGQDFSGVRVHTGGQAAESARAVNARAYTVGRDVVFGEGQYAPGSDEGRRLVAHELVHVGQQGRVVRRNPVAPVAAALTAGETAGIVLGTVGIAQNQINTGAGSLSVVSDQATYPVGVPNVPEASRSVEMQAARFTSSGVFVDNDTIIYMQGDFGSTSDGKPTLANVRFNYHDTTSYSHSLLSFTARALQTAYGTPEDPKLRFECTGRFDPAGLGDCSYHVILEVDKTGGVRAITHRITNGNGRLLRRRYNGFTLDIGDSTYD